MKPGEITSELMLAECERELAVREKVYPRWITMKKIEEKTAKERIELMKAMCDHFQKVVDSKKQPSLF